MKAISSLLKIAILLLVMLTAPKVWAQGPPYQTDDPTPVDFKHCEAYIFGSVSGTPVAYGTLGPAFEFNWGAIHRVQIHVILPLGTSFPTNNPIYAPSGQGPQTFGLTDMEFGVKLAIIKQTKHFPQIGTFTMIEIPTGNFNRGLSEGKTWFKLPVWLEKEIGPWTLDGGVGYALVRQTGFRDFLYAGFLVKREITKKLELGVESFSHAREGLTAPQTQASSMIDIGGYYHFKREGLQFLFAYGHSVTGQTENYAYLGLYYTWGKDDKKPSAGEAMMSRQLARSIFR